MPHSNTNKNILSFVFAFACTVSAAPTLNPMVAQTGSMVANIGLMTVAGEGAANRWMKYSEDWSMNPEEKKANQQMMADFTKARETGNAFDPQISQITDEVAGSLQSVAPYEAYATQPGAAANAILSPDSEW